MNTGTYRGDLLEFKVIISDGGNTYQKEIKGEEAARLVGLRIDESFDGRLIGESGTLQVTGGTDKDGFPMRRGIPGSRRTKILVRGGVGFVPRRAGQRRKKMVRGDTISEDIVQINTKLIKKVKKKPKKVEKEVEEVAEAEKEVRVEKVEKKEKEAEKPKKPEKVEKPKRIEKVEKVEKKEKEAEKPKKVEKVEKVEKKEKEVKKIEKVEKVEKPKKVEKKPESEKLIALTKIRGVGKKTADLLSSAGLASAQDFLEADIEKLAKKTGLSTKQIEKLKAEAEQLVR
jgi:small subunit ribosomal protein S6e